MSKTYNIGPLNQANGLVADFAEAVSPFFIGGGIISREFAVLAKDPVDGYNASEDLIVRVQGVKSITFAEFQTVTGVKIAHAETDFTGMAGKILTIAAGTEDYIKCLIFYTV